MRFYEPWLAIIKQKKNQKTGMTLIELILVITIFGIIGTIASQFLIQGYRAAVESQDLATVDEQARVTIERIKRDLREARSASALDLILIPSTQITFTDIRGNIITFARSGNTLTRQVGVSAAQTLAQNVTGFSVSYRDTNGTVTGAVGSVRLITIDMTMTLNDVLRTYRFTIYPRNYPK